jgi:hypothetical protein
MVYDLSNTGRGVRDCPRCRHTMERLRSRLSIRRNEGYLLDDREGDGSDAVWHLGLPGLALNTLKLFYRYTLQPLTSKLAGEMKERRLGRVLQEYPESLICPHCNNVLKRK